MFYDIEQNTDSWLDLRSAHVTGTSIKKIMPHYGKAFGEPAKDAAVTMAREMITGKRSLIAGYKNAHMDRGHDQEPIAIRKYEEQNFVTVRPGGFFEHGNLGCSPDGLIFDDGSIEVKSVIDSIHYKNIKRGGVDPAYKWQVYFNLKIMNIISDVQWIDFVSYCGDYPEDSQLYIFRVNHSECDEYFNMINVRLREFFVLVESAKNTILGK